VPTDKASSIQNPKLVALVNFQHSVAIVLPWAIANQDCDACTVAKNQDATDVLSISRLRRKPSSNRAIANPRNTLDSLIR
jgi:hypothetical protein